MNYAVQLLIFGGDVILLPSDNAATRANKSLTWSGDGLTLENTTPAGGGDALVANPLSQFAQTTLAQLNATLSDATLSEGGLATGDIDTSAKLAAIVGDETGTNLLVFSDSPTLVTPALGVATATTVNKVTLTAPATSATITATDGTTTVLSGGTHSGTNTGDQTTIVGITGTKAEFDTAVTDGNFLYAGDVASTSADMVLADAQTNTGVKTFLDTTLALRNVANTFDGTFTNTNTADRIYTLQDAAGTIAFLTDITGTNSGTNTGDQTITLTGDVTGTGTGSFATTIAVDAVDIAMLSATGTADGTTFLRGDNTWAVPSGGAGDMVLADAQTVTGAKTFLASTLLLRNVANTFNAEFTNTNTADRIYTLQDAAGTIAFTSDITGTNSGTNTGDQTITLTGDVTGTGTGSFATTIATDAVDIAMLSATGTADGTTFLRGDNTWAVPGGSGDMVLASAQTNTGAKTFLDTTFLLRNVANTFNGSFTNTNTADRVYTLQDAAGTIAFTSDITGTNSGTNTGDQTITLTGDVTGTGTGSFATTIAVDAVDIAMLSATGTADGTTFLRGDNTWAVPAGSGDMVLATPQTVTGAKTFDDATLLMRNVADTFDGRFTNTNTADRIYTLQDAAGTIAFTSDITGDMDAATYDPATIAEQLVGLTATQTLTNKTLTSPVISDIVSVSAGDINITPDTTGTIQLGGDNVIYDKAYHRVNGTGRLIVGHADGLIAPFFNVQGQIEAVSDGANGTVPRISVSRFGLDGNAPSFQGSVADGTYASPTSVPTNTPLVRFTGDGYVAGTGMKGAAQIVITSRGAHVTQLPGQISFQTSSNSAAFIEAMKIDEQQRVLVSQAPTDPLEVANRDWVLTASETLTNKTLTSPVISDIVSVSAGDISLTPDTTGNVSIGTLTFDADQTVGAGQDNFVLTYDDASGLIVLEASTGSGDMVLADTQTVTGAKTFSDGTLLLDDSDSVFDLVLQSTSTITTANKTLTIDVNDGDRTLTVGASTTLSGGTHSGTNTGDQTSIVGLTGTKAEFNTELSDGTFLYVGDGQALATGVSDVTATAAELNLLDLAGLTVGWVLSADSATTASWKAQTGGSGGAFTADGDTQITPTTAITLDQATGNEIALDLSATVNKATSGDYTLLFANVTETAAPGTDDKLIHLQVGGADTFTIDNAGVVTTIDNIRMTDGKGMVASTTDSNDTDNIGICGGGALSHDRGAFVDCSGNEHSTRPGVMEFYAGNVAGGELVFYTSATERMRIQDSGEVSLTNNLTFDGATSGTVTMGVAAIAGTHSFSLPTSDGTPNQFLQTNGSGQWQWATPAGSGDMVLADVQTVTGNKTFEDGTLLLRNVADTFSAGFTNTNTAARTYTLQDADGTLAFTSDITGTNSGTNTGDQTITLTGDVTGTGTGSFATTIAVDAVDIAMLSATGTADATTFLRGDNTWATPGGSGDMILASAQTNTGAKTFNDTTLLFRNVANTFDGRFTNTVTADRVYTLQDADGTVAFTADVVGQQSIYWPARNTDSRLTDGAADGSFETSTNKVMVFYKEFSNTQDEFIQFDVQMPKGWNEGSILFQAIWSHAVTTVNFGVSWALQAQAFANDDALDSAWGTAVNVDDTGGTTDDIYTTPESAAVTIAGSPGAEEWVKFQMFRDVSQGGDTLGIKARLVGIRIHYTTDAATDD